MLKKQHFELLKLIENEKKLPKIAEFLKGKEKNGKIMSKEYIIKAIIFWDINIF